MHLTDRLRGRRWGLLALAVYCGLALVLGGVHVLGHFSSRCACGGTPDLGAYAWFIAWWPHALAHGFDPLFTRAVWWPVGTNLAQAASIPIPALAAWPVTALAGPLASYNVLAIAGPATSAFAAYLICRWLTRNHAAALLGGFLFGFSSYEFAQLTAHINMTLTFPIPLLLLLACRRGAGEISRLRTLVGTTVLVLVEEGISTELLFETVLLGVVLFLVARPGFDRASRRRLDAAALEMAGGGIVAAAISLPFLLRALQGGGPHPVLTAPQRYGIDLLNLVLPTQATTIGGKALASLSHRFTAGNLAEADGYLGVVLLVVFVAWAVANVRRSMVARLCAATFGLCVLLALGVHLEVEGHQIVPLAFAAVRQLPLLHLIVPARLMLFVSLAVAIGVTCWLRESPPGVARRRWGVAWVGALLVLPNPASQLHGASIPSPSLFRRASLQRVIPSQSVVLVLPYGNLDQSMLWQAQDGFRFRMPEGYTGISVPQTFQRDPVVSEIYRNSAPPPSAFAALLRRFSVDEIVIRQGVAGPWARLLERLHLRPRLIGGAFVYRVGTGTSGVRAAVMAIIRRPRRRRFSGSTRVASS